MVYAVRGQRRRRISQQCTQRAKQECGAGACMRQLGVACVNVFLVFYFLFCLVKKGHFVTLSEYRHYGSHFVQKMISNNIVQTTYNLDLWFEKYRILKFER